MERAAKKFFTDILETPSPSGYERPVQEIVRNTSPISPTKSAPICTAT